MFFHSMAWTISTTKTNERQYQQEHIDKWKTNSVNLFICIFLFLSNQLKFFFLNINSLSLPQFWEQTKNQKTSQNLHQNMFINYNHLNITQTHPNQLNSVKIQFEHECIKKWKYLDQTNDRTSILFSYSIEIVI